MSQQELANYKHNQQIQHKRNQHQPNKVVLEHEARPRKQNPRQSKDTKGAVIRPMPGAKTAV